MNILRPAQKYDLLPQHQTLIDASAIAPEVAAARGYRSVTDPADLRALGFADYQATVPGLLIPMTDAFGQNGYHQYRPDTPRQGKDSKPIKYETAAGARLVLDVPAAVLPHLGDPSKDLWHTEGVRKVDSLLSAGLLAIGVHGVFGFRGTNARGGKTLLPDWEAVAINDRTHYLAFDSDLLTNPNVRAAVERHAAWLRARKGRVRFVLLPNGRDGKKMGVDDVRAAGSTVDDLLNLVVDDLPEFESVPMHPAIVTAAALQRMTFPEPKWAVPGLVPEGAALFCGPPKIGKSRLALQLACAVAYGGVALSHSEVATGGALVLALEDGQRRLQDRLSALLGDVIEPWPEGLVFATEWPKLGEGGEEEFHAHLTEHPETRLVVVDVLQMVRPAASGRESAYAADYNAMRALKAVADTHNVALVVLHHTRKLDANDPLSLVSGTNGLAGAVDSVLILQREPNGGDATLYLRGRDVEEAQFTLAYDRERGAWNVAGEARAQPLAETREAVVQVLERAWPEPVSPKVIATTLDIAENTCYQRLHQMEQSGRIRRVGRGLYTTIEPSISPAPYPPTKDAKEAKEADPALADPYLPYPSDDPELRNGSAEYPHSGNDSDADLSFLSNLIRPEEEAGEAGDDWWTR
jgi:hypothetical protein